ncbi:conserved protein of unknown function [Nitrospira japonica]|uniref:DNA methyltransferase n=1 Tax=Nitrospira japonica TaxID=1325564 RepID=A0A1W1I885_9BACT|nr:hypothetical protein [Nitrospira japonica]SLM49069.1 conserved protein of unknown function [Nitrospira japonica]
MDTTGLIINLISGAVGGNAAGAAMPDKSLGTLGNSLAGLLGGGVGGAIIEALAPALSQGGDLGSIIGNIAGGGVGGGLLMIVASLVKNAFAKA